MYSTYTQYFTGGLGWKLIKTLSLYVDVKYVKFKMFSTFGIVHTSIDSYLFFKLFHRN